MRNYANETWIWLMSELNHIVQPIHSWKMVYIADTFDSIADAKTRTITIATNLQMYRFQLQRGLLPVYEHAEITLIHFMQVVSLLCDCCELSLSVILAYALSFYLSYLLSFGL